MFDDPEDFGRIAAPKGPSDVAAMGATPLFALALVALPVNALPIDTIRSIVAGGEAACRAAGVPIAGGHTIDSVEPIYGLVAIGVVDPRHLKRNAGARPGDALVLGKPLGVGIYSAALKKEKLDAAGYAALRATTTKLNTPGIAFGRDDGVHALTDVTGFGLLGHLLEVCRGSGVAATIDFARVPLLPATLDFARLGYVTGASGRNFAGYGDCIEFAPRVDNIARDVLTDPQTSGGLLVACAPERVDAVLATFRAEGFGDAAAVGEITAGAPRIVVR
jgi:selenide,water dikinase